VNHRRLSLGVAFSVVLGWLACAVSAAALSPIEGDWRVRTARYDGVDFDPTNPTGYHLTLSNGNIVLTGPDSAMGPVLEGTYTLHDNVDPRQIDVKVTKSKFPSFPMHCKKDDILLGIYKQDSGGNPEVCFASPGKSRPDSFEAPAGSAQLLMGLDH
jgi:uncharacterized protein (TIGR03067 family)